MGGKSLFSKPCLVSVQSALNSCLSLTLVVAILQTQTCDQLTVYPLDRILTVLMKSSRTPSLKTMNNIFVIFFFFFFFFVKMVITVDLKRISGNILLTEKLEYRYSVNLVASSLFLYELIGPEYFRSPSRDGTFRMAIARRD